MKSTCSTRGERDVLPPEFVRYRIAHTVGGLGKILIDDALDLFVRLEARRHDVCVSDGLEEKPQKSRVLRSPHDAKKEKESNSKRVQQKDELVPLFYQRDDQ